MRDGVVVAAVQEERLTRLHRDPRLPVEAWRWCLAEAGLLPGDVDVVAYYEEPAARRARQLTHGAAPDPPLDPVSAVRERLGFAGPVRCYPHHASHAASAFLLSPHPRAAVMTVDGVGEWDTATFGRGEGARLEVLWRTRFPHSLGLLYSAVTAWLGFAVNSGEAKVMGLAAHGRPRHLDALRRVARVTPEGIELDPSVFDFRGRMASPAIDALLGGSPRIPDAPLEPRHADVAASVQRLAEDALLAWARRLHAATGLDALCLAGGVALNCVAVGKLLEQGPFREVWVQPAAGDAGGALGAAALAHVEATGGRPAPLAHVYLGPAYPVEPVVAATGLPARDFQGDEAGLLDAVVDRLAAGAVVGWFSGRLEFGPRALGARSILADPRRPEMRDHINLRVKRREPFRPFGPSVLPETMAALFPDAPAQSPYMVRAHRIAAGLPAVTHVDGTSRPQTVDPAAHPRYAALLARWHARTGCPALLNTSFNVRGEPIVCTPVDALFTFVDAGLDALVLEDRLIDRADVPAEWPALLPYWRPRPRPLVARDLYTF